MLYTCRHSLMRTLPRAAIIATMLHLFLTQTQVTRAHRDAPASRPNAAIAEESSAESMARRIASNHLLVNFDVSLAVKEDADFLLTPALLAQETLREDVVVTYPTE